MAGARIPETDLARVRRFCEERIPAHLRDQIRLEVEMRGRSVTIVECRPYWLDPTAEWTRMKVAQFRYDEAEGVWTLYWRDRNERWNEYWDLEPSRDIEVLLAEVGSDPTGIFWG